jgi:hypothetical protein
MNTVTRRAATALGAAVLLSSAAALSTFDAASAYTVEVTSTVKLQLGSAETTNAINSGASYTGSICSGVSAQLGNAFSDQARSACPGAVAACAHYARTAPLNNAYSATRFAGDGTYTCLAV